MHETLAPECGDPHSSRMGLFSKIKDSLTRTREAIVERIEAVVRPGRKVDEDTLEQLEELLLRADVGVRTTDELIEMLRIRAKEGTLEDADQVRSALRDAVLDILRRAEVATAGLTVSAPAAGSPYVVLVMGVNGVGKTTSIGKLAHRYASQGKTVLVAASDTFRAAAADQLGLWADRAGVQIVRHKPGSDPASVAFDALTAARARNIDVVLVDTAGRLHTKANLMEELKKVHRVLGRAIEGAPHESLLVLDATTGQNALAQARGFSDSVGVSGLVLAKIDGTAKGGIVVAIARELSLPVRFLGVGETIDDLVEFEAEDFADGLFAPREPVGTESQPR